MRTKDLRNGMIVAVSAATRRSENPGRRAMVVDSRPIYHEYRKNRNQWVIKTGGKNVGIAFLDGKNIPTTAPVRHIKGLWPDEVALAATFRVDEKKELARKLAARQELQDFHKQVFERRKQLSERLNQLGITQKGVVANETITLDELEQILDLIGK